MARRKRELMTAEFRCLDNGHLFSAEVWHWVHYPEEGSDEPGPSTIINADDVRCPYCGSRADVAKV